MWRRSTLPAGGAALTAHCTGSARRIHLRRLGIGSFQGPVPVAAEPPLLPLPAVTMQTPSTVRAGGDLVYEVTLTNAGPIPIDLIKNCPDFGQDVFVGDITGGPPVGMKPAFQLNCGPAGTIQPGEHFTFEIRLALPRDLTPGAYTLFFTVGYPWSEMTTPTSARLTVTHDESAAGLCRNGV